LAYYVDTSAAVKLIIKERETGAMRRWYANHDGAVASSDLLRTELIRTARRVAPDKLQEVRAVLDSITLLPVPSALFERAGELAPELLRSLDALHLAAALSLGDDLEGFVTYDDRLAAAATANGITVVSPGA